MHDPQIHSGNVTDDRNAAVGQWSDYAILPLQDLDLYE